MMALILSLLAQSGVETVPAPLAWVFSGTGILALIGLAVKLGSDQRQRADHDKRITDAERLAEAAVPRNEFVQRMDRLEDRLDKRLDSILAAINQRN
jgi:hypothetical protein